MTSILESILTADTHAFGILVKMADMNRAQWLSSNGYLTSKKIHAIVTWDSSKREHFEERARNIEEQNPGTKAWVREL
jgi:hypothetical protein